MEASTAKALGRARTESAPSAEVAGRSEARTRPRRVRKTSLEGLTDLARKARASLERN